MQEILLSRKTPDATRPQLPEGVNVRDLKLHIDDRGALSEVYRQDWLPSVSLFQWNVSHCVSNSLRGVHLHLEHSDFLVVLSGRFVFGLRDLRRRSPTFGLSVSLELPDASILIPPGVAHGFHCLAEGTLIYGLSHTWDIEDDLACRWDDPALDLDFGAADPILSRRDAEAGSFRAMLARYEASPG